MSTQPDTDPAAWREALALLDDALDLPLAQRAAWLENLTTQTPGAKEALARMLKAHAQAATVRKPLGGGLPAWPEAEAAAAAEVSEASALAQRGPDFVAGQRLGPWSLVEPLGQGGMASVWLAQRADGAHARAVALKLPHVDGGLGHGLRAAIVVERFARERSILSSLNHPNIAQIMDAGVHEGQPWLAMELVRGCTITEHVQQQRLSVRERLQCFLPVLRAAQHAHAQLVIHRDIKPANVMVSEDGQAKMLDFGVAKLLEADGAVDTTELTRVGGRALTPQYASPEQIAGTTLGTASDIYSLGVLLYQVLTNRLPYTLKRGSAAALEEAILLADIAKPSSVVSNDATLARALRGDVDTIVMKALQVQASARYASAAAFADDIERHLQAQPIQAQAASLAYRLGKLWQRQKLAVSATAAVSLAVLAGSGVAIWQAREAQAQAQKAQAQTRIAEAVQQFMVKTLQGNNLDRARGRNLSALDLLKDSAQSIDAEFGQQPELQRLLHETVRDLFLHIGERPLALTHSQRVVELRKQQTPSDPTSLLMDWGQHTSILSDLERFEDAVGSAQQGLAVAERMRPTSPEAVALHQAWRAELLHTLAWNESRLGRHQAAMQHADASLAALGALDGGAAPPTAHVRSSLAHAAQVYANAGQERRARELQLRSAALADSLPDVSPGDRILARGNLGRSEARMGRHAEALALLQEAVAKADVHFKPTHDRTISLRGNLALAQAEMGQHEDALQTMRTNLQHALDAHRNDLGAAPGAAAESPNSPQHWTQQVNLLRVLKMAARTAEAAALADATLMGMQRAPTLQPALFSHLRTAAAEVALMQGQHAQGLAALEALQAGTQAQQAANPNPLTLSEHNLALAVAMRAQQPAQAAALSIQACEALQAAGLDATPRLARCHAVAAWMQGVASSPNDASARATHRAALLAAREQLFTHLPVRHALRAELLAAEAELMPACSAAATQRQSEGRALFERLVGQPMPWPMWVVH
jgi:eukaryotic-like serine/threonine-protein kinase